MARAAGPERRLLAIYTGGTIGMRSEGGGESAYPRPRQNGLRAWPPGALGLSLARGEGGVASSGGWESAARTLERVRGMVTLPDLKCPEDTRTQGQKRELGRLLCSVPRALGRMLEHSTPSSL